MKKMKPTQYNIGNNHSCDKTIRTPLNLQTLYNIPLIDSRPNVDSSIRNINSL